MASWRRQKTTRVAVRDRTRRTSLARRGTTALALAGVLIAGTAATGGSGGSSGTDADGSVADTAPISFAMAVKPGSPVPMRIVTEKSKGELDG